MKTIDQKMTHQEKEAIIEHLDRAETWLFGALARAREGTFDDISPDMDGLKVEVDAANDILEEVDMRDD